MSNVNSTRKCPQCGAPITAKDPRTKFCSIKCSRNFRGEKQRAESGRPKPGTKRECEWCEAEFTITKHPNRYCSPECGAKGNGAARRGPKGPKPTKPCKWCGELYEYEKRSNRVSNFCSLKCSAAWKSANRDTVYPRKRPLILACEWCGAEFPQPIGATRRFCSKHCAGSWIHAQGFNNATQAGELSPQWRGGHENYRGPSWGKQRRAARRRDKYTCQDCGVTETELGKRMEVHHIIPFGRFGLERHEEANALSNLVSLCGRCHRRRDGIRDTLFR